MKRAKIILLILMALLAIAGLVVTFKPLMERASRQKQVDEANNSFIQQLEQITPKAGEKELPLCQDRQDTPKFRMRSSVSR